MLRNLAIAAAAAAIVLAVPAGAYDKLPRRLAGLSPAHFAGKVAVDDDPLNPAIVLSTVGGYTRGRPLQGAFADDVHLRALIDRQTGEVSWQVWHKLAFASGQRDLGAVHYRSQEQVREVRPLLTEHGPDRCPPTDAVGYCGVATVVAFELPESTVREIAESHVAGDRTPWRLRFKDAAGRDVTGGLAPAEAAGLIAAVEVWRHRRS